MSTTLTALTLLQKIATAQTSGSGIGLVGASASFAPTINMTIGNLVNQAQIVAAVQGSVTNGTPYTLNLITGNDQFGNALGMAHLMGIFVANQSIVSGQDLTIGGGTHSALGSDAYTCQANGGITTNLWQNPGLTVTGSSTDTITIVVASGTAVPFQLLLLGR